MTKAWQRLFNGENRFWCAMGRLGSLIALNALTLLCCLPVITAGASLCAASRVCAEIRRDGEPDFVTRAFFAAMKRCFAQATAAWLIALGAAGVFSVDLVYALTAPGRLGTFFLFFAIAGYACVAGTLAWLFALIARFENTLGGHIKNALRLALGRLPATLAMVALWAAPVAACLCSYALLSLIAPLWLLIGFAGAEYLCAVLRERAYPPITRP